MGSSNRIVHEQSYIQQTKICCFLGRYVEYYGLGYAYLYENKYQMLINFIFRFDEVLGFSVTAKQTELTQVNGRVTGTNNGQ